jgi:hypothetical protein
MNAVNIADHLHNEDAPQQRISTFSESSCCSSKQDCRAG